MGTRACISFVNEDKEVVTIVCSYDGYPTYVGKVLETFYNIDNIGQLMSLGNLSSLGKTPFPVDEQKWHLTQYDDITIADDNGIYFKCCEYKTVGYENEDATVLENIKAFKEHLKKGYWWDSAYHYIYRKSKGQYSWYLLKFTDNGIKYERLSNVLKKKDPDGCGRD